MKVKTSLFILSSSAVSVILAAPAIIGERQVEPALEARAATQQPLGSSVPEIHVGTEWYIQVGKDEKWIYLPDYIKEHKGQKVRLAGQTTEFTLCGDDTTDPKLKKTCDKLASTPAGSSSKSASPSSSGSVSHARPSPTSDAQPQLAKVNAPSSTASSAAKATSTPSSSTVKKWKCTQKWFGKAPFCGDNETCPQGWGLVRKDMSAGACDSDTKDRTITCEGSTGATCRHVPLVWNKGNMLLCQRCLPADS
ncbi:hypothetical protein TWF694_007661 [Orbilia ellipsospora]|uniref:Uncharacterized protein n=1 Tax=Orbilia ellipsospora TaxID=2528407 RepID=A0AAV9XIE4_9PEZI